MSLFQTNEPGFLESGPRARLIPVNANTSKEGKITSSFLASFMSVDEFAKGLLSSIGVRLNKTAKVECFTEVVFKNKDRTAPKIRPDGLIVVTTGKKQWMALIEAKVGKSEQQVEQIEAYLDLAKEHKIDAVITLSNQFVATPSHHFLPVKKNKTKAVALYHWSWTYLISEAVMWVKYHGVTDPDQCYILEELVRYMQHESSGVLAFERMNGTWKDVCANVQGSVALKKKSIEVQESVGSWHQFVRNISLHLSLAVGEDVTVFLKKAHRDDADTRLKDDIDGLIDRHCLHAEFDVPDAAGRIKFIADVEKRIVSASMYLKAPEDRSTSKGKINWLLGQLKKTTSDAVSIRVVWPGRARDTMKELNIVRDHGFDELLGDNRSLTPVGFEIVVARDLGAKFKGAKTFIQESESVLMEFYEHAGQHLKEWVSAPPKLKTKTTEPFIEDVMLPVESIPSSAA